LVNNLNSAAFHGTAQPYLTELARDAQVRSALYPALTDPMATKDEKIGLARVLVASGGNDSIAPLETLSADPDTEVAEQARLSLKNLHARLP